MRKTLIGITASMAILGFASSAPASVFFQVDDNTGLKMSLDKAKDSSSAFGTVLTTDDIAITATGLADFSNGSATIKPVKEWSTDDPDLYARQRERVRWILVSR